MIAYKNRVTGVNDVSVGSPSRIRIVLLISFGITTLPKSSILLTIPVAFIYKNLLITFRRGRRLRRPVYNHMEFAGCRGRQPLQQNFQIVIVLFVTRGEFILQNFTFWVGCNILYKNEQYLME